MGKAFQIFWGFFLKVSEGFIRITRESKGILTTVLCRGVFLMCFVQDNRGRGKGEEKVDYSCLNCQDVKRRLPENSGIRSL